MNTRLSNFLKILSRQKTLLASLVIVAVVALLYASVRHFDFIFYDDPQYVLRNPQVLQGLSLSGVVWAFKTFHACNWHPLTWLSHMLDIQLFGLNSGMHHLTNLLLHAINSLLVFIVLQRISGAFWRSALVALVFAVHPLHVESVAWVAERKDVLSTLFWLLTMGCYARYAERPASAWYLLALTSFVLGLLAKPMLVTLPFVLLMLDVWPLGRISLGQGGAFIRLRQLVWEKAPFFLCSFASSVITLIAQNSGGAVKSIVAVPMGTRVGNAMVAYATYFYKMLWPENLAVFYPHPGPPPTPILVLSIILFLVLTSGSLLALRKRPWFAFGWFWYLGTLVPVIGLVQVGSQSLADRYMYIPSIGVLILLVWSGHELFDQYLQFRPVLGVTLGVALLAMVVVTSRQVGYWSDSITLFRHALSVTEGNYVIEANLGQVLVDAGRIDEGVAHCRAALDINPDYADAHGTLGNVAYRMGNIDEAVRRFRRVIELDPYSAIAHYNLGIILFQQNRLAESVDHFRAALRLNPNYASAQKNLQRALARVRGDVLR